jgi:predicted secreted acid phosphatase
MAAPALPGAAAFVAEVRRLGGHVVIVTNRDVAVCDATRANLSSIGINAAAVLCQPPGPSDKNPRFEAVARGGAADGLPPLRVVMYIGDNVRDFPGLTQAIRTAPASAFDEFGRSWFLLPNPMYGSWESNPVN